jgi:hypothetical protein
MRKTLFVFRAALDAGYDYVVRSNLSTFFDWTLLGAWLAAAPRSGLLAGTTDGMPWVCGCCIVLSRDVIELIVTRFWDRLWDAQELDDVVLCRELEPVVPFLKVPRVDSHYFQFPSICILCESTQPTRASLEEAARKAFAIRVKSQNRTADAITLSSLASSWARARQRDEPMDKLMALYLAQVQAYAVVS